MKKIALVLLIIITLQASVFAATADTLGTVSLVLLEHSLVALGVDRVAVSKGHESNYWGSFWGTTILGIEFYPIACALTVSNNEFGAAFYVFMLTTQFIGGWFGNQYLLK